MVSGSSDLSYKYLNAARAAQADHLLQILQHDLKYCQISDFKSSQGLFRSLNLFQSSPVYGSTRFPVISLQNPCFLPSIIMQMLAYNLKTMVSPVKYSNTESESPVTRKSLTE
jgi:hypothetical protein